MTVEEVLTVATLFLPGVAGRMVLAAGSDLRWRSMAGLVGASIGTSAGFLFVCCLVDPPLPVVDAGLVLRQVPIFVVAGSMIEVLFIAGLVLRRKTEGRSLVRSTIVVLLAGGLSGLWVGHVQNRARPRSGVGEPPVPVAVPVNAEQPGQSE